MLKSKKAKISLAVIAAALIAVYAWYFCQIHFEPKVCFRPMIFYSNTLFWDEKAVDGNTDGLEYVGTVNSCVPNGEKPDSDFECNSELFMNAKLYRDDVGNYYIYCTNGKLLLLDS